MDALRDFWNGLRPRLAVGVTFALVVGLRAEAPAWVVEMLGVIGGWLWLGGDE